MHLAEAIARLYALRVDTTTRDGDGSPHEKPHKPLLLLAALDLIDAGLASPDHIPWCQALRDRFSARFEIVKKLNDRNNPDLPVSTTTGAPPAASASACPPVPTSPLSTPPTSSPGTATA
ncbi:MAG: hypothetical protein ACLFS1_09055, partial [Opitutales bacterium]